MKTSDIFNNRSSKKLNEGMEKTFGTRLNLESFTNEQLEDSRNRLRTQIYNIRSNSGFNDLVESDSYTKAQWMLDAINSELAERSDDELVDSTEIEEGEGRREIGQQMADDGITYSPEKENEIIGIMAQYMERDGMDRKQIRYLMSYDEDYIGDQLSFLPRQDAEDGEKLRDNIEQNINNGEDMNQVRESATDKASAVVTAKTMVDRVGRWIEELAGMENDTLLSLGDTIRDEMGQEQAKSFLSAVAPAIQQALENLKATRETLATGVRSLTGEIQPAELIGADGDDSEIGPVEPDAMNMGDESEMDTDDSEVDDEFAAAEPAVGGVEVAGRAQRESIDRSNQLLRVLAG
jgi:hypothetical protein